MCTGCESRPFFVYDMARTLTSTTDSEAEMAKALGIDPPAPAAGEPPPAGTGEASDGAAGPKTQAPEISPASEPSPDATSAAPSDASPPPSDQSLRQTALPSGQRSLSSLNPGAPPPAAAEPADADGEGTGEADAGGEQGEPDGDDPTDNQPRDPAAKPSRYQKRINDLTRGKTAAEQQLAAEQRRRADLEARLEALTTRGGQARPAQGAPPPGQATPPPDSQQQPPAATDGQQPPAAAEPLVAPKENEFESHEEYLRAREAYLERKLEQKFDERLAAQRQADAEAAQRAAAQRSHQELIASHTRRLDEARKVYADFDAVTQVQIPVSPAMEDVILHDDAGAHLMYYLAKHPEEAEEISGLSMGHTFLRLGKLAAEIDTASGDRASGRSSAPPNPRPQPVTPLATGRTVPPPVRGAEIGDYQEYKRQRSAGRIR